MEMYFDYKSSPTSIKAKEREYASKTIYFHVDVKACVNKYIANLRTIEIFIYNSVSMSGGQLIRYQQLIVKLYEGKSPIGAYGR